MRIPIAIVLPLILGLVACGEQPANQSEVAAASALEASQQQEEAQGPTETERLYAFFQDSFDDEMDRLVLYAAFMDGRSGYTGWGDVSDNAYYREPGRIAEEELGTLRGDFDFDELTPQAQVSYLIFEHRNEARMRTAEVADHIYGDEQIGNFWGFMVTVLTTMHPIETLDDAEAYVSRLNDMERALGQRVDSARLDIERGMLAPAYVYPLMLQQIDTILTGAPFEDGEDSVLLSSFRERIESLELDLAAKDRLLSEAVAALEGPVTRGFAELTAIYEEASAQATETHGVWALPDGERYYREQINYQAQTEMTADEIHEFGLAEVARIQGEMRAIIAQLGFEGSIQDFFEHLHTDPENHYPDTDEGRAQLIADAELMTARVLATAPQYFDRLPEADVEVRRVPSFREDGDAKARYFPPSVDGTRPGIYWVNLGDMDKWQKHTLATLSFHEAVPGHHFQSAISWELIGVPDFQRFMGENTAYSEGWGLYAERLAGEMGMHDTLYSEFGRLVYEIWRDVRLVVDTGIHHRRWTHEQALTYMMENTGLPEEEVRAEINRYFVWPGQALAYRLGMERILSLRAEAGEALGDEFDIREFHNVVLGNGAVPMPVLDLMVEQYIQEQLAE